MPYSPRLVPSPGWLRCLQPQIRSATADLAGPQSLAGCESASKCDMLCCVFGARLRRTAPTVAQEACRNRRALSFPQVLAELSAISNRQFLASHELEFALSYRKQRVDALLIANFGAPSVVSFPTRFASNPPPPATVSYPAITNRTTWGTSCPR